MGKARLQRVIAWALLGALLVCLVGAPAVATTVDDQEASLAFCLDLDWSALGFDTAWLAAILIPPVAGFTWCPRTPTSNPPGPSPLPLKLASRPPPAHS